MNAKLYGRQLRDRQFMTANCTAYLMFANCMTANIMTANCMTAVGGHKIDVHAISGHRVGGLRASGTRLSIVFGVVKVFQLVAEKTAG